MSTENIAIPGVKICESWLLDKSNFQGAPIQYPGPDDFKDLKGEKDEERLLELLSKVKNLRKTSFEPTVNATLFTDTEKNVSRLKIQSFIPLFLSESLSITSQLDYYYNLALNHDSTYELIVYILTNSESTSGTVENTIHYLQNLFYFDFKFQQTDLESFNSGDETGTILMEEIKSVKVYFGDLANKLELSQPLQSATVDVRNELSIKAPGTKIKPGSESGIEIKKVLKARYPRNDSEKFASIYVNEGLLAPQVMAVRDKRGDKLVVNIVGLLNESLNLELNDIGYYYNFELSELSENQVKYKLNLYITFEKKAPKITRPSNFDAYIFGIHFQNEIPLSFITDNDNSNAPKVPLKDINTVGVCIVQVDPETSRGTETGVQEDD